MKRFSVFCLGALVLGCVSASQALAGSVSGRLLDASGKPVGGAKVQWTRYRADDEVLLDQGTDREPAALGEAATDAEGRFRVVLDKPGVSVALRITPSGLPSARFEGPFDSTEDVSLEEIWLPAAKRISGRVLDEAGKPVSGAKVTAIATEGPFETDSRFVSEARTGADGGFSMPDAPDGAGTLTASAMDFVPLSRFAFEAKREAKITLKRGGVIRGTVLDMAEKPVTGALVTSETSAAETDAEGRYRLTRVAAGSRSLQVIWKEDFAARKDGIRVRRGEEAEANLRLTRSAVITGVVLEESTRKPIAGARVAAWTGAMFNMRVRQGERTARSDAQGKYKIRGLALRPYTVGASKEGFLPASIPGVSASVPSPGTANLALARAASVAGRALDEKGEAVAGARVRLVQDSGIRAMMRGRNPMAFFGEQGVLTGPDGKFRLKNLTAGRNLSLEAQKTGYAAARKAGISIKTGEAVKDVSLLLRKGLEARGRVLDASGQPLAGAEVRASLKEAGDFGGIRAQVRFLGMDRGDKPDAVSGADGSFLVRGLEEGEYSAVVTREGFSAKTAPSLEVKASGENIWPPISLAPGHVIAGSVRDSAGQPISGAQIFAIAIGEATRPGMETADVEGRFRVGGFAADRPIMLNVSAEGFATSQKNVTPPAEDVTIVLKNAATIRGRVEDADTRRPVADFTLARSSSRGTGMGFMMSVSAGGRDGTRAFQSEDGSFELGDVPAGKWILRASAPGYRAADVSGIEVGEGETKEGVLISLRKGGTLIGRVLDPGKGAGLPNAAVSWQPSGPQGAGGPGAAALARMSGSGNSASSTDADGRFRFEGLPEGKVTLSASHRDYVDTSREVDPEKESSVDLTLGTGGSISGTVVGKDGRTGVPGAQVTLNEQGDSFGRFGGGDSARTDGSGAFLFEHLKPGRFSLTAQSTAGRAASKEVVLTEGQRLDGVLLETATGGTLIRGTVTGLPTGKLGGVRIFSSSKDYNESASSDDSGAFTLRDVPPGALRLSATTSFLSGRSASKNVEVPEGAPELSVEILFEGTSRLAGRVTRAEKPLAGLFISANPEPPRPTGGRASAQTDEDGRYALEGLGDGNHMVTISGQGGVSYRRSMTVSGETAGDIALPAVSVTGIVTDAASGEPLEGASVSAQPPRETTTLMTKQGVSDSTGRYSLDDVDPGSYQVTARKAGFQARTQTANVGSDSSEMNFALQRGTGLTIRVGDGLTGLPLRGVSVLAYGAGGTVAFIGSVSLDPTGKGEISSIGPGRYAFHVFSDGYAPRSIPGFDVPGPMLTVALTPGGRVEVRTETPVIGRIVDASGAAYLLSPWRQDGRVSASPPISTWENFAPGAYRLLVSGGGGEKSYPFNVVEGGATTVEVK